jgi:hypothetical protein
MRTIILALLAISCFSVAAQPVTQTKTATSNWLAYTDPATGISVKYPPTWRLKTTNPKAPVVLHAPTEGEDDTFSENINYIVKELPAGQKITLNELATSIKSNLANVVDDFVLDYEKKMQWAGVQAVEYSYSGTSKGANAGVQVKLLQRVALIKGNMLLATYSAQDGKTDPSRAEAIQIINLTTLKN